MKQQGKGGKGSAGRTTQSKRQSQQVRKMRKALNSLKKTPDSSAKIKNYNHTLKATIKKAASSKPSGKIGGR